MLDNDLKAQAAKAEDRVRANKTTSMKNTPVKIKEPIKSTFTNGSSVLRNPSVLSEGADMTDGIIISNGEITDVKRN